MNSKFLMEIDYTKPVEGFGDKLSFGGTMVLVGMLAVFSVLFVIYLSLVLFKFAFKNVNEKKEDKSDFVLPATIVKDEPAAASSNDEIVAVIAAAIAMAESEANGVKFRVVSFKRV